MKNEQQLRVPSGTGATRGIAVRRLHGKFPGLFWLGGFKSDMSGTKASALADYAARTGRAYVRFDYSGHGESDCKFEDGTISSWLEDALAVFESQADGPQILVGSSMGGWMALLLARSLAKKKQSARLAGMVLIAPAPDFTEDLMWAQFSPEIRRDIEEKGFWQRPSAYGEDPYPITRALIEDGRKHVLLNKPIELGCPVRILQGAQDVDVPYAHALKLVSCLAQDDVVLTLVKDGDHRLSRPEDLERLFRIIDELLESIQASA
jgi:pimeloyl-ACP methyl ester carboxylesterase